MFTYISMDLASFNYYSSEKSEEIQLQGVHWCEVTTNIFDKWFLAITIYHELSRLWKTPHKGDVIIAMLQDDKFIRQMAAIYKKEYFLILHTSISKFENNFLSIRKYHIIRKSAVLVIKGGNGRIRINECKYSLIIL